MGRVVILGAKGMLGTDLSSACTKAGLDVSGFDLPEFDITDDAQLANAIEGAQVIVNCAAYTNVEKAESERQLAFKVNAEAVGRLGNIAKQNGVSVLHISTDFVFDGTSDTPYVETDAANALSAYGASKLAGETELVASGCKSCIIRVEWTYGAAGTNFVKKLLRAASAGKPLKVVDDQIGAPTATTEVADAIVSFLKLDTLPEGIFHFAAAGFTSRYEMARFMFDKLAMDVSLSSCKSDEFVTAAKRPLSSRFDCSKIENVLDQPIKPWQQPLEKYIKDNYLSK
ncbi:MAG TPA: dTDP-4-dehydrorhamnose reductase [Phycisphaerales bacterium]|nr:dTDP-4-dehydrorhamnose reductase [Phycisphaerales bacterium]